MSRICELTGKTVMTGNTVSHANNKTRRRFLPNLFKITLLSESLERKIRLRVSAAAIRSVEHHAGLDAFLLSASSGELSSRARVLQKHVREKRKSLSV